MRRGTTWLLLLALGVGACGGDPSPAPSTDPTASTPSAPPTAESSASTASSTAPGTSPSTAPSTDLVHLKDSFVALERDSRAELGLAVAPAGGGRAQRLGELPGGPAWSTAKVPLARAALARAAPADRDGNNRELVRRALRNSDNTAAEALWSGLGSDSEAAEQVTEVLRQAGDQQTTVPSQRERPGFSIFGQSDWALTDQASYGGTLTCLPHDDPVRDDLRHVRPDQQWGLGRLDEPEFKGGWGPGDDGAYLVRQFGTVQLADGRTAGIAIAAVGRDGSYASGTAALDDLAQWVGRHVQAPAATPC